MINGSDFVSMVAILNNYPAVFWPRPSLIASNYAKNSFLESQQKMTSSTFEKYVVAIQQHYEVKGLQ